MSLWARLAVEPWPLVAMVPQGDPTGPTEPATGGGLASGDPALAAWSILILLVGAWGTCTAAALLTYSPTKIGNRLQNGRRKQVLEDLDRHDADYQLLCRAVALLCLLGGVVVLQQAGVAVGSWIAAGIWIALTYGLLPGPLAEHRAESVLLASRPILRLLYGLLRWPLVWPARQATDALLRLLRLAPQMPADREEIADEILAAVSDSAHEAELEDEERTWLGNIVELRDLHVSEAMTPRTDMISLADNTPLREALRVALDSGFSRYPVYEGKVDQVVGVFYAKDALKLFAGDGGDGDAASGDGSESDTGPGDGTDAERGAANGAAQEPTLTLDSPVRAMMRQPLFVPESTPVVEMLRQMKATKKHMAIVLDEYGGTDGIISVEDIIEEIVGDISDEYDSEEEAQIKVVEPGRVLEVSARTRVAELNDALGCDLSDEGDFDTLGGFVLAHLGRIPKSGETFHVGALEFHVLSADDRKLGRLRVASVAHPVPES